MSNNKINKNMILYGPPGTGKTYNTAFYAVAIVENKNIEEIKQLPYDIVMDKFKQYKSEGIISFTTFHQSYGYEEFIEGIRPIMDEGDTDSESMKYQVCPGVFKAFCDHAAKPVKTQKVKDLGLNSDPVVWKVSLDGTYDNPVRSECMENDHIRIGWDGYGEIITDETDFKDDGGKTVLNAFINKMKIGDIILSCYSASTIDAIGVVTGEYEWNGNYDRLKRVRNVKWIAKGLNYDIVDLNGGNTMTLASVYRLNLTVNDVFNILATVQDETVDDTLKKKSNHVFIIDEINRGNISKIFGELITLIEESKRIGGQEEITVKLPYSQKSFGVPDNVYIIGTMNTADRSIALMDTALRRRFTFVEMLPNSSIFNDLQIGQVNIGKMLECINNRICVLRDREHMIGHAYFMPLFENSTINKLGEIFENSIVPLLQEYFYDDYEKIRKVLGDNQKNNKELQFILEEDVNYYKLFGDNYDLEEDKTYYINKTAFFKEDAYLNMQ